MIQVRYNMWETNSSSACTLVVYISQADGLDVPNKINIDSNASYSDGGVASIYSDARYYNEIDKFLNLLAYAGVKEIYVDGKQITTDPTNHNISFMPISYALAVSFNGEHKKYFETYSHGGEIDCEDVRLTLHDIVDIQNKLKDPNYEVHCGDGDEQKYNEIEFPYTKPIPEHLLIAEQKRLDYKNLPTIDYGEDKSNYDDTKFDGKDPYEEYADQFDNKKKKK